MLDPKEIGFRISALRELKSMTLEEIANKIGVSKSTVLRYERGEFERIKLPVLISIANALGTTPEYLSGQTDDDGLRDALIDLHASQSPDNNLDHHLTTAELELLRRYRRAPQNIKDAVDAVLAPYGEQTANPASSEPSVG